MAKRKRDYKREYQRRVDKAKREGFKGYYQKRKKREADLKIVKDRKEETGADFDPMEVLQKLEDMGLNDDLEALLEMTWEELFKRFREYYKKKGK